MSLHLSPSQIGALSGARVFASARLHARRWRVADAPALHAVYGDPEGARFVGDGTPITPAQCDDWIRVTADAYLQRGYGMFALDEIHSGDLVGFCGIVHPGGQPEPEIKYSLLRSHWRRGLATELVPALLGYGARSLGLSRVIATVDLDHAVSRRVLAGAGMTHVTTRVDPDGAKVCVYAWLAPDGAARHET